MPNYFHEEFFQLESGKKLPELSIYYETFGTYLPGKSKVIWVCHALTANANVFEWWPGLFGENDLFNPKDYFIVSINNLGSCYGSTGPLSKNPETDESYFHTFPEITIKDMAAVHELLRQHLNIDKIHLVISGSQGGQQAMEWAIEKPIVFENLILIATNAVHSPWGIAFNETQRMAIESDESWKKNKVDAGLQGMKTARAIALISYRNYDTYQIFQSGLNDSGTARSVTYQRYQGEKLAQRFNAFSYWTLSKAMDSHDVGRKRRSVEDALKQIKARTFLISISSDLLFPPTEQQFIAAHIPNAEYEEINSAYGHDGFLVESKQLSNIIKKFIIKN
jgi:homoserine O-acetyltransferase